MFYHSRDLKYVKYGKVEGFIEGDDWLRPAYEWLDSYCGFCPQVWLSRSTSDITGKRFRENGILFGFSYIRGFGLDYGQWENALIGLTSLPFSHSDPETRLRKFFQKAHRDDDNENLNGENRTFPVRDYSDWKDNYLFVENDQVVVPRLNLKSAKEIIVDNERKKRALRKMRFIEDRIKIMNGWKS